METRIRKLIEEILNEENPLPEDENERNMAIAKKQLEQEIDKLIQSGRLEKYFKPFEDALKGIYKDHYGHVMTVASEYEASEREIDNLTEWLYYYGLSFSIQPQKMRISIALFNKDEDKRFFSVIPYKKSRSPLFEVEGLDVVYYSDGRIELELEGKVLIKIKPYNYRYIHIYVSRPLTGKYYETMKKIRERVGWDFMTIKEKFRQLYINELEDADWATSEEDMTQDFEAEFS